MHHISFIHSSVDGYLGCFLALSIVNSAAENTGLACIISIYDFHWIYSQERDYTIIC